MKGTVKAKPDSSACFLLIKISHIIKGLLKIFWPSRLLAKTNQAPVKTNNPFDLLLWRLWLVECNSFLKEFCSPDPTLWVAFSPVNKVKWSLVFTGRLSDVESFGRATKAQQNGGSLNRYGCLVSVPELLNTEVNCVNCEPCLLAPTITKSTVHDKVCFLLTKTCSKPPLNNKPVEMFSILYIQKSLAEMAKSLEETWWAQRTQTKIGKQNTECLVFCLENMVEVLFYSRQT